ncbi:MAG: entericidin A/B family lipoprotein [Alphaproteobacteria bacterium]|nr:entericidin A/B family lipoprotein [Alphaproteobacteria bacterium]
MNKTVLLALAALSALATAACSTVAGAGRDISTAGEVVTETAEDTADDLND